MEHWYRGNCGNWIPCGQCADDADSRVTVDDVTWRSHKIISQINCTKQLHKLITQIDCTRQDDVMSKNGNVE